MKTLLLWCLVCLSVVAAPNSISYAASTAIPVCIGQGIQLDPRAIAVGDGGFITVWARGSDFYGSGSDLYASLYAQRTDSLGRALWNKQGVRVSSVDPLYWIKCSIIPNGHGGAIIAFSGEGSDGFETYVQQILSDGTLPWGNEGIRLDHDSPDGFVYNIMAPALTSDGADGAIIGWHRSNSSPQLLMKRTIVAFQRVDNNGVLRWAAPFVSPLKTANEENGYPVIASDGSGGAFAIYSCFGIGQGGWSLKAQRLDAGGNFLWSDSSTILTHRYYGPTIMEPMSSHYMMSSQQGRALFTWTENVDTTGNATDLHLKALDLNKTGLWESVGIPGTASPNTGLTFGVAGDGRGGAIYLFNNGSLNRLIAQRVDSAGQPQWGAGGVDIAPYTGWGSIASDSLGGAFISWQEGYNTTGYSYIQYIDAGGRKKWGENGIVVTDNGYDVYPNVIADGMGNAVVVYNNKVNSDPQGIYAQKVDSLGNLIDQHIAGFASRFTGSWCLVSIPVSIEGDSTVSQIFPDAISQAFTFAGGYRAQQKLQTGQGYFVKFQNPRSISVIGTIVEQKTINVVKGWNLIGSISSPISVDSLACDPDSLFATGLYGYDGTGYAAVDRLQPCNGYWMKFNGEGTIALRAPGSTLHSKNQLRVIPDGELPPPAPGSHSPAENKPTEFSLTQNYPNPFNPATTMSYALPMESHVRLSICNVLGQEVRVLVDETQQPGYKSVQFDASRLPSGLYFYRIVAGTFTDVKKMVLLK